MTTGTVQDTAFVMLDPAVEVLEIEIAEYRLLCHTHFEVAMAVPPGEGLLEFLNELMGKPVNVGSLRKQFDDQQLVDEMLVSLSLHNFLLVTSESVPSIEELTQLRNEADQIRKKTLRRSVVIDLDVLMSIEHLCAHLYTVGTAPEVRLLCNRLAEHKITLAELSRLRQAGKVRMHQTVVQTTDLTCDSELCQSLISLGASVLLEGVPWLVEIIPNIPGLSQLTRNCVAVHVLMTPDLTILDPMVCRRVIAWATSVFISGLCLKLEADALWPTSDVGEDTFLDVLNAVRMIEEELGDVLLLNLPSDEVLLGNTASVSCPDQLSDLGNRFRRAYMRWRIPYLKSCEGDNTWSQIPEVEDKLVRAKEDLLPNHPELLLLRPGSFVVDVCGGLGRVARRLAPAVGPEGLIISIEMFRCLSDRARRFACERDMLNLHFRPGLAQRIPLADSTMDAAINEWTGGIWELGIGPAMIKEMTRVVRPGGRIAVTHRLVRLPLTQLGQPWVQYEDIYDWMRAAFVHPELTILAERVWGQTVPTLVGENATLWRKQYMPRLINPYDLIYERDEYSGAHADIYLTILAQRQ